MAHLARIGVFITDKEEKELKSVVEQYANEKVKEVVKEIQSQAKDSPITENWIGFNAYL